MKILFASDFHFGLKHQGLDRHEEILKAFRVVVDKSRTVDLTVFGGDVFHTPRPAPREYAAVIEGLQEMGSDFVWIPGNHEVATTGDALEPFRQINFERGHGFMHVPVVQGINGRKFLFCPYVNDARAAEFETSAQKMVNESFERAKDMGISAAFCHLDVDGALVGDEEFMLRGGRLQMPLDIAKSLPCDVLNGHIHKQQVVQPNIIMPGSPVATDFGERNQEHGYCYVLEV